MSEDDKELAQSLRQNRGQPANQKAVKVDPGDEGMQLVLDIENTFAEWKVTAKQYDEIVALLEEHDAGSEDPIDGGPTVKVPTGGGFAVDVVVSWDEYGVLLKKAANKLAARYKQKTIELAELFMALTGHL